MFELSELTGPPRGEGPQTEENRGALSAVMLGLQEPGLDDGTYVVAKVRVTARFPDALGDTVKGRVFFATRTGSQGVPVSPGVGEALELVPERFVTLDGCEILLRAATPFIRCDVNDSGRLEISDAIWILGELFLGNRETACPAARDCDADGEWRITDAVYALTHLFLGGLPPPAPFPECGFGGGVPNDCAAGSTRCQ